MIKYYVNHLNKNFGKLFSLLKNNVKWSFDGDCLKLFENIKNN